MSAIIGRGRRGNTVVPNWRWEDPDLDVYDLRVAGWLASHTDAYTEEYVTRNEIARRIGISRERVSTSLERLEDLHGIISVQAGGAGRSLRIVFDFDAWEGRGWTPGDHQVDAYRPVTGRPASTTKDIQQETQEGPPQPPAGGSAADEAFTDFWMAYPRRESKPRALKAYGTAAKKVTRPEIIAAGLRRWTAHWMAAGTATQFIPLPATWLNGEKWNDPCPAIVAEPENRSQRAQAAIARLAARGEAS